MGIQRRVELPLVGGSDGASAEIHEAGRSVNLYVEVINGKPALRACPGEFRFLDVDEFVDGTPPFRGFHVMGERFFVVVGNAVGEVFDGAITGRSFVIRGYLPTSSGRVGMSDNAGKVIIGDGTGFFLLDPAVGITQILTDESDVIAGYASVYINQQTLFFLRDSGSYYYSDPGEPGTVPALNFFDAESNPDATLNAYVLGDKIKILGVNSTEDHWNSGGSDNAFERVTGSPIEYGSVSRWSSCLYDNTVAMVGRNKQGAGKVYRLGGPGRAPQIISNQAVEEALAKVLFAGRADKITMWSYEEAGHAFLVINLPSAAATVNNPAQPSMTWVYDAATQIWHERGFWNPNTGAFERVLADHHAAWQGRHYTGAYNAPHVYELSLDYFRQNTEELRKLREFGPLTMDGERFTVYGIEVEMLVGVGRDGGVQGSDPQIMLRSRFGTGAWSNIMPRSYGRMGKGKTRVTWGPQGSGEAFFGELTISDPTRVALTRAWALVGR